MRSTLVPRGVFSRALFACGIALGALGCGDGEGPTVSPYPRDGELRMNQLQSKGTHNSYHVAQDPPPVAELAYSFEPLTVQLTEQGVRALELDVNYHDASGEFEVFHIILVDEGTHCRRFVDCLKELWAWSERHPGHQPLFVQIEPKGRFPSWLGEAFFEDFEAQVLMAWPRERVITPDDVQGNDETLDQAVRGRGWPSLGESRGKIVFFLNDSGPFRAAYTREHTSLAGRLMFAEASPGDPYAGFVILNDPLERGSAIRAAVDAGYIVRTRADSGLLVSEAGSTEQLEAALESGAQVISTDYPAPVSGTDYVVNIPGGTPSRCNPRVAPADCEAADIESPGRLRGAR
ncbi:MAG: hypothetical protein KIT72_18130 [Polyangiaceae bacterium]|nr:hypothetical protein [Polyangiaceae bacterium]MCW5792335.1 hypothetical protein [Polyangiaceae bacterium]